MGRLTDEQLGRPAREHRGGGHPAYFIAALVAALVIWTVQQNSIQDSNLSAPPGQSASTDRHGAIGDVRSVFSADDYPPDAQRNNEEGTVQARLSVGTDGRVSSCSIIRSSGHRSLDEATCRILERRARFKPAHDANGKSVASSYVTPPVVWRLEG